VTAFVAPYLLISNVHSLTLDQKELKVSELRCCLVRTVGVKKQEQYYYNGPLIKKINDRMLRKSRNVTITLE